VEHAKLIISTHCHGKNNKTAVPRSLFSITSRLLNVTGDMAGEPRLHLSAELEASLSSVYALKTHSAMESSSLAQEVFPTPDQVRHNPDK
jgi:hypothetical protein